MNAPRGPAEEATAPRAGRAETLLAALCVILLSNALIGPLFAPAPLEDNVPELRLIWPPVYAVVCLLTAIRWRSVARFWLPALVMLVLVGWTAASVNWSIDPDVTHRRTIAIFFTSLFGLYLAAAFEGRRLAELIAGSFLPLAVASWFVCLAIPSFGVDHNANVGAWKGLWYEKNQMGLMMVMGVLASAAAAYGAEARKRWIWLLTLGLCLGLVLMTRSKTSLMCVLIALGGTTAFAAMRRGPALGILVAWLTVLAAGFVGAVIWLTPELFYKAIGKDPSLTGRTDIWAALMRRSAEHPWVGYGYSAFWEHTSIPATIIRRETHWPVPNAHNGWLDLLIQLGWIGVGLFAVCYVAALLSAPPRTAKLGDSGWAPVYLVIFGVLSLSESVILVHNSLVWASCVAAMARMFGPLQSRAAVCPPMPSQAFAFPRAAV